MEGTAAASSSDLVITEPGSTIEQMVLEPRATLALVPIRFSRGARLAKRAFDIAFACVALLLSIPLLMVLMASICIETPGSPVFMQDRLGLSGQRFKMLKLRTMVRDAEARRAEVEHLNESKPPLFKARRDPRMTRVGRFLRATSLDELPQLVNVILGHMSMVGPRPRRPHELDLSNPVHLRRLSVRPGLAGLWQVSGRAHLDFDAALAIDLRYIDNWSFGWDLTLVLQTALVVVRRQGAY